MFLVIKKTETLKKGCPALIEKDRVMKWRKHSCYALCVCPGSAYFSRGFDYSMHKSAEAVNLRLHSILNFDSAADFAVYDRLGQCHVVDITASASGRLRVKWRRQPAYDAEIVADEMLGIDILFEREGKNVLRSVYPDLALMREIKNYAFSRLRRVGLACATKYYTNESIVVGDDNKFSFVWRSTKGDVLTLRNITKSDQIHGGSFEFVESGRE